MIYTGLNKTGEVEAIYGHLNGVKSEVSEVYGSIDYNDPIFYSRNTLTGTSPLTFKGLGQSLKDYHIFGETVQNGTPSPDYPVDVQGVGERTENLFDVNSDKVAGYINDLGDIVKAEYEIWTYDYIDIYGDIDYTYLGYKVTAAVRTSIRVAWYDANKSFISRTFEPSDGENPRTVRAPINARYMRLSIDYGIKDIVFIEGSTPPDHYIPYGYKIPVTVGNVTTPIYIGSDPLYRIGDYADEIDFGNQRIIRRIKKVIINGTESMTVVGPYGGGKYKLRYRGITNSGICSGKEKDTHFRTTTKNMDSLLDGEMSFIGISSRYVDFCKDTTMRSLQNWRDYFAEQYSAGTPVIILYVLATPTTESVTIPTLTTITGDNALSIGTTIQPSAVSITGHIKPTGYGQLLDANDVDIQDSTGEPIYIQG